jgi:hypothetical protein
MELARTIMEIMKGTAENSTVEDVWFQKKGNYSDDMEVYFFQQRGGCSRVIFSPFIKFVFTMHFNSVIFL